MHDIIENTEAKLEINFQSIASSIIYNSIIYYIKTETTAKSLYYLTKQKEQSYNDYIYNISQDKLATKVKLADIVCNLADSPSEHAKQKYLKALPILLKGI